jgi:hypothetical protein
MEEIAKAITIIVLYLTEYLRKVCPRLKLKNCNCFLKTMRQVI